MKNLPSIEDRLKALLYYVPTGTTEGEKHILNEAFVQTEHYQEIITPPPGSPRLLVGKKGSGKSAIIDFSIEFLRSADVPTLLVKPMDLDLDSMPHEASSGTLTRIAYEALMRAIARNIGDQLSGFLRGDSKILYQEAVGAGSINADFIGKISQIMAALAAPLSPVDFTKLLPNTNKASCVKLEKALRDNINSSGGAFYLFVDDTDQVASPGAPGHVNRIWAILLAAREIAQRINSIRVIISLREEVWRRLSREEVSQRDQWDHFIPLVFQLNQDLDHVQGIIERRLVLAAKRCGIEGDKPHYQSFFEGDKPHMPSSQKRSTWPDIIRTRSRERPRDAVQLVNMLAKAALGPPANRINDELLAKIMVPFSQQRAVLLAQEYEEECPALANIIKSFARIEYEGGAFSASSETIRSHLRSLPSSFSIELAGLTLQPDNDEDIFRLWNFLYSIGFIYARVSDSREPKGYRFISPADDILFVHSRRWNDMQKALWEIHPSFRDHLIDVGRSEAAQFGLPKKPKKHRPR